MTISLRAIVTSVSLLRYPLFVNTVASGDKSWSRVESSLPKREEEEEKFSRSHTIPLVTVLLLLCC